MDDCYELLKCLHIGGSEIPIFILICIFLLSNGGKLHVLCLYSISIYFAINC